MTAPISGSVGVGGEAGPTLPATLTVTVFGVPAMQGSKKHVGRGVMVESSTRTRPWRENVRDAARTAIALNGWQRLNGPVAVYAAFYFDRPRSHYRTGRNAHLLRDGAPAYPGNRGSGDLDKMLRAAFDSLVDAGVMVDDSQVVRAVADKRWAGYLMDVPGALLTVRAAS